MNLATTGTCTATGARRPALAAQPDWAHCGETLEVSSRGLEVLQTLDDIFAELSATDDEQTVEAMSP